MAVVVELDVRQAAAGDREAFARLLEATRTTVCSIALAVVRDVDASEDVAQDVYVHAWRGLPALRNPDSFLPWLRQLARNRANAFLRADRAGRRTEMTDEIAATLRDPGANAEAFLVADAERRALREALDALNPDAREVLILFYREDQSVRQVARLLELSEAAVKKRLERAREALRESVLRVAAEAVAATKPGATFSLAVLALLPPMGPTVQVMGKGALIAAGLSKGLAGVGSGLLSGALGAAGLLVGYRRMIQRTADDAERRALTRLMWGSLAVLLVQAFALGPLIHRWPRPEVLLGWYASLILALGVQFFWLIPRVTATRRAAERASDPAAQARQAREFWLGVGWFLLGAALGGAGVVYALPHLGR
jgi:RNA polymerase sigma factor (sigma-70 family)